MMKTAPRLLPEMLKIEAPEIRIKVIPNPITRTPDKKNLLTLDKPKRITKKKDIIKEMVELEPSRITPSKNLEEEVTMLVLLNKNLKVLQAMKLKKLLLNPTPTINKMVLLPIPHSLLKSSTKDKVLKPLWTKMNQSKKSNK
jgi:hypothetical protein